MTKQKLVVVTGSLTAAIILIGGGFVLGRMHFGHKQLQAASADYSSTDAVGGTSGTPNTVPLDQASPSNDNSGGLSVSSGSAGNMGQLGGNKSGQSSAGGSQGSGSSSSASPVDPSTFSQYDKYKDSTNALFGDIQKGSGATLGSNQTAEVVYKGWLTNGTLFDESRAGSDGKIQPFAFTMGAHQVIPGWEEGLNGMQVGGVRLVIVPPSVGYGAQGQGSIPPNSVLVFEVQLVGVK